MRVRAAAVLALAATVAVLLAACGGSGPSGPPFEELTITCEVDRDSTDVGGSPVSITATVTHDGEPVEAEPVMFSTTLGTLSTEYQVTGDDGISHSTLDPGDEAGTAEITVWIEMDGAMHSAQCTVDIEGPAGSLLVIPRLAAGESGVFVGLQRDCDLPATASFVVSVDQVDLPTPLTATVSRYEVSYLSLDTGGSEVGVDVPAPVSYFVPAVGRLVPFEEQLDLWPVLEAAAAAQEPLAGMTCPTAVNLRATVTFWAHPVLEPEDLVSGSLELTINVIHCPPCS